MKQTQQTQQTANDGESLANALPALAYQVENPDDDGHIIIFSSRPAEELDEEFDGATRYPAFDQYAHLGYVPNHAYLAAGWWLTCDQCGEHITSDDLPEDASVGDHHIYCCGDCADSALAEMARRRHNREAAEEYFAKHLPYLSHGKFHCGSPGLCGCFSDDRDNVFASVTWPGAKIGNNHFCFGCKGLWICRGDYESYEATRDAYLAACGTPPKETV